MNEHDLDKLTAGDMDAIGNMLIESDRLNIQTEVVYSFAKLLMAEENDIRRACYAALNSWDC